MTDKSNLLDYIARSLEALGTECYIEDIGGTEAVTVEFTDPDYPDDCSVSVVEPADGITGVSFLVTVFTGLDREQTERAAAVVGHMNKYLSIGSYTVLNEGAVFLGYTFILDEELPEANMLAALFASLDTVSFTAADGKQQLLPLINGEITCEDFLRQDDQPDPYQ